MQSRVVTQRDLATHLGISQALVSRALSGTADQIGASGETVERILRLADEWGYRPSAAALALKGASTRTLGVVVKQFEDPYFGQLIGALQGLAREAGHSLLLCGASPNDLEALRKHRVDGVILAGSDFSPDGLPTDTRIVQIGSGRMIAKSAQVGMNEAAGIRELIEHLAGMGHRNVGFICSGTGASKRRRAAVRQTARGLGMRARMDWVLEPEGGSAELRGELIATKIQDLRTVTAWVAADDLLAIATVLALHRAGVRVPDDLSIAGFDDIPVAQFAIPPLTTVRQPLTEMAEAAFEVLLATGLLPANPILVAGELVVRDSTNPPKKFKI